MHYFGIALLCIGTFIYIIMDFRRDFLKEIAIDNGMDEKEARDKFKWKTYLSSYLIKFQDKTKTGQTETEDTMNESTEDESLSEMSKHIYW